MLIFQHDDHGNPVSVHITGLNGRTNAFTEMHEDVVNTKLAEMNNRPTITIPKDHVDPNVPLNLRYWSIQMKAYDELADAYEKEQMLARYGIFDDKLRLEIDGNKRYSIEIVPTDNGDIPPDQVKGEKYGAHLVEIKLYEVDQNGIQVEGTDPVAFDAIIDNEYAPQTSEHDPNVSIAGAGSSGNSGSYNTAYDAAKVKTNELQAMLVRNNPNIVMAGPPNPNGTIKMEKKISPSMQSYGTIEAELSEKEFDALGKKQGAITIHDVDPSTIWSRDPSKSGIRLSQFSSKIVKIELMFDGNPDETSILYIRGNVEHVRKLLDKDQFRHITVGDDRTSQVERNRRYNSDRDWFNGPDMWTQFKAAADSSQPIGPKTPASEIKAKPLGSPS